MKSRICLPVSIAAVGIAAFALVFCHKNEDTEMKKSQPGAPRTAAQTSRPPNNAPPVNSPRIGEKKATAEPEPDKVLTPEEEEKAARFRASTTFKFMVGYALDHDGHFPPDTSALLTPEGRKEYGFPYNEAALWLGGIIDYRGRDITTADDGRLLLMRYRIGGVADKEVRLYVNGKVAVVPSSDPIPEDSPPSPPGDAPR